MVMSLAEKAINQELTLKKKDLNGGYTSRGEERAVNPLSSDCVGATPSPPTIDVGKRMSTYILRYIILKLSSTEEGYEFESHQCHYVD